MKKKFLIMLVFLLMLVSIPVYAATPGDDFYSHKKFNGKMIYRGVVFGQGPVAKLFPQIWSDNVLKKANNEKSKEFVDRLLKRIQKKDPSYFNELKQAVYSRDYIKTEKLLEKGGGLLKQGIKDSKYEMVSQKPGGAQALCVVEIAYIAFAVTTAGLYSHAAVATAAGGVTVYLVVVAAKYFWASSNSGKNQLQKEMLVKNMVTGLAG